MIFNFLTTIWPYAAAIGLVSFVGAIVLALIGIISWFWLLIPTIIVLSCLALLLIVGDAFKNVS